MGMTAGIGMSYSSPLFGGTVCLGYKPMFGTLLCSAQMVRMAITLVTAGIRKSSGYPPPLVGWKRSRGSKSQSGFGTWYLDIRTPALSGYPSPLLAEEQIWGKVNVWYSQGVMIMMTMRAYRPFAHSVHVKGQPSSYGCVVHLELPFTVKNNIKVITPSQTDFQTRARHPI
jgi:hypothetical protein